MANGAGAGAGEGMARVSDREGIKRRRVKREGDMFSDI
jgi:hypothetical protein